MSVEIGLKVMPSTYTRVELVLSLARGELRNHVRGMTRGNARAADVLRRQARRPAHVASTSTASRELVGGGFACSAFAQDSSVCVDSIIVADVTGA